MRKLAFLAIALIAITAGAANAWNYGDSWILPIADRQGGGWIQYAGAGYGGSDAWGGNTMDGVRRVIWKLDQAGMPASTEMYKIEFFVPTQGATGWQPIESIFNGSAGETWPVEPGIPWVGAFGTNHEYIGAENGTPGTWKGTGPGPHTPVDATYNAGANGELMWLKGGSWLYAKWDYGWAIDHTWSALRVTVVPEPGSMLALAGGLFSMAGMALRRRK